MRSNTEGWSNQQLNDRIELLETKLEVVATILYDWLSIDGTLESIISIIEKITEPSYFTTKDDKND